MFWIKSEEPIASNLHISQEPKSRILKAWTTPILLKAISIKIIGIPRKVKEIPAFLISQFQLKSRTPIELFSKAKIIIKLKEKINTRV